MDLLQTVKKEGSRGGRGEFKWDDVKADAHRENYLGHSLMAPVGRWQRNRDLSWYAKDGSDPNDPNPEKTAADARAAEIKRVKEAEEDAMALALGLPPKIRESSGANAVPVAGGRQIASEGEVRKAIEEGRNDGDDEEMGKGRGFTGYGDGGKEVLEGEVVEGGLRGEARKKRRSRSRSREKHRERRYDERRGVDRRHHRERSRSRSRERHRRRRSRSRERERDRDSHRGSDRHNRSDRRRDDRREERRGHDRPRSRSRDRSRDRVRQHHSGRSVSPHERRDRDRRRDW